MVWAVSAALGAVGLLAMAGGLVDLLGDGDDTVPLLVSGGSAGLLASVLAAVSYTHLTLPTILLV